jgi:hypothetical protein
MDRADNAFNHDLLSHIHCDNRCCNGDILWDLFRARMLGKIVGADFFLMWSPLWILSNDALAHQNKVNEYPCNCGDGPDNTGEDSLSIKIGWFYSGLPFLLTLLSLMVNSVLIWFFVRRQTWYGSLFEDRPGRFDINQVIILLQPVEKLAVMMLLIVLVR